VDPGVGTPGHGEPGGGVRPGETGQGRLEHPGHGPLPRLHGPAVEVASVVGQVQPDPDEIARAAGGHAVLSDSSAWDSSLAAAGVPSSSVSPASTATDSSFAARRLRAGAGPAVGSGIGSTSSMVAIGAASPRRGPAFTIRV